jgi:hypothetical protein
METLARTVLFHVRDEITCTLRRFSAHEEDLSPRPVPTVAATGTRRKPLKSRAGDFDRSTGAGAR